MVEASNGRMGVDLHPRNLSRFQLASRFFCLKRTANVSSTIQLRSRRAVGLYFVPELCARCWFME
jgi:hypothetical protein